MANEQNLKPFVKGDKRINRKGRPKNFDMLRTLTQAIASEAIDEEENGKRLTRVEKIVRDWLNSRNFQKQKAALELAYGKVPDALDITSQGKPIEFVEIVRPDSSENDT